jgi:hypothetical protein
MKSNFKAKDKAKGKDPIRCDTCDVTCYTQQFMDAHLSGRTHKAKMDSLEKRKHLEKDSPPTNPSQPIIEPRKSLEKMKHLEKDSPPTNPSQPIIEPRKY